MQAAGCHQEGWQCPLEESLGTAGDPAGLWRLFAKGSQQNHWKQNHRNRWGWIDFLKSPLGDLEKNPTRAVGKAQEKGGEWVLRQSVRPYRATVTQ